MLLECRLHDRLLNKSGYHESEQKCTENIQRVALPVFDVIWFSSWHVGYCLWSLIFVDDIVKYMHGCLSNGLEVDDLVFHLVELGRSDRLILDPGDVLHQDCINHCLLFWYPPSICCTFVLKSGWFLNCRLAA